MARDSGSQTDAELQSGRRGYLKWLGVGAALPLAGCTGGPGDTPAEDTSMDGDGGTTTASSTPVPGSDRYGGRLDVGYATEPQDLHPFFGVFSGKTTMELMYSRLTQLDNETAVEPALATNWEHAGNARSWTFELREGVVFPNTGGTKVTAVDVKASAEAVLSEKTAQDGTSHVGSVESMEVVDDYTFSITLEESDLFYPKRIAEYGNLWNIAPKDIIENSWDSMYETDYGTGPYNLVENRPDDFIRFERNPDYWRADDEGNELPYLDGFEWHVIPDSLSRVNALRDQRTDAMDSLPFTQLSRMATADNVNIQEVTTPGFAMALLNVLIEAEDGSQPFKDVKVRKAMKHAMDREQLKSAVDGTSAIGHHDPVPPTFEFYNPFPKGLEFGTTAQVDEARQLLDDAGYPDGFKIPTPFVYTESDPRFSTWAVLWQEQMKNVGIEIEIQLVTSDTWISKHWNNDDSFFYSSWGDRLVDPTVHKLAGHTDSAWNASNWSNEAYDEQWETAMNATDFETFKEAFYEMQRIYHLEGPWLIWGFTKTFTPYQNYVRNVDVRPSVGKDPFTEAYLTEDAP